MLTEFAQYGDFSDFITAEITKPDTLIRTFF